MKENVFFTTYLMGGLGNQMFQIGHTLAQGFKHNVKTIFKTDAHTPMQGYKPTKYLKTIFRNIEFVDEIPFCFRMNCPWGMNNVNPSTEVNTEFYGYFQSSKNFYGFDEKIKETFSPTNDFLDKISKKYPELLNQNNVSIHIRRGDYLKISDVLPVIDISYIDECLSKIDSYDNIFVLTDDKNWADENIKYKNIIIPKDLEDYEELWLISLCRYNIMSNSTFSWWGAYLNKNVNKRVFVPNLWFGPKGEKLIDDLYESEWEKINVKYENGKLICC